MGVMVSLTVSSAASTSLFTRCPSGSSCTTFITTWGQRRRMSRTKTKSGASSASNWLAHTKGRAGLNGPSLLRQGQGPRAFPGISEARAPKGLIFSSSRNLASNGALARTLIHKMDNCHVTGAGGVTSGCMISLRWGPTGSPSTLQALWGHPALGNPVWTAFPLPGEAEAS